MFLFGQPCEGTNWAVGFEIFPVCFPESTEITLSSSANHEMETACVKWFSNEFSLGECFLILLLLFNVESMARRYFWFLKKKFTVRIRFSEVFTSIHLWDQKYLTNSHFWKSSWSLCSPAFVLFECPSLKSSKSLELQWGSLAQQSYSGSSFTLKSSNEVNEAKTFGLTWI